jgi:hypothetical protein
MRCPECGRYQGMELHDWEWQCLWRDCNFRITTELIQEIKDELLSRKTGITIDKINCIRKYL